MIVSSGDAAQAAMVAGAVRPPRLAHRAGARQVSSPTPRNGRPTIERVPLEEAEGIVCTGLFDDLTETPDDYRATILYGKDKGLKLLCANPDIIVDVGDRRIYCAGAIAAAYSEVGGGAIYFGKPHPPIYDLARRRLADADRLRSRRRTSPRHRRRHRDRHPGRDGRGHRRALRHRRHCRRGVPSDNRRRGGLAADQAPARSVFRAEARARFERCAVAPPRGNAELHSATLLRSFISMIAKRAALRASQHSLVRAIRLGTRQAQRRTERSLSRTSKSA